MSALHHQVMRSVMAQIALTESMRSKLYFKEVLKQLLSNMIENFTIT
jgi:hypothetical protein